MINLANKHDCCGCGACSAACPKNCIAMVKDEEGFFYPDVTINSCVDCHLCEKVCPVVNKPMPDENMFPRIFAAKTKDEETRRNSSSGGVFSELANYILAENGTVYGAAFSADFRNVFHVAIKAKEDLCRIRGSKYVQSNTSDVFPEIKKLLENKEKILFSASPCQVNALKCFLKKDYKNLYTVDFICHGVPSPELWSRYVEYREQKAGANTRFVSFRDKKHGWNDYELTFTFSNGKTYRKPFFSDWYMRGFMHNLFLRPSCYHCSFRGENRISDITLADFWGVTGIFPEMNDNKGTSLLMVHSKKGHELLSAVEKSIEMTETDRKSLLLNPSVTKSPAQNNARGAFIKEINNKSFESALRTHCKMSGIDRIMRWRSSTVSRGIKLLKKILHKV